MKLLLILTTLYAIGAGIEYLYPGLFPFEAIAWVGLILIIGWAIVVGRDNRKVVGQVAYRTGQLD